jgi:MFS family permease
MAEKSNLKNYLIICVASIACLMMSGPLFGFTALKAHMLIPTPRVVKDGVWCGPPPEKPEDAWSHDKGIKCDKKNSKLNYIQSAAYFLSDATMLLFGELSDVYGPRTAMSAGLFFVWGGFLVVALDPTHVTSWYICLVMLGFGGPGCTISIFALGQTMPDLDWLFSSMLSATFDGSSFVFTLFAVLYDANVSVHTLFYGYTGLCVVVGLAVLFLLPQTKGGMCSSSTSSSTWSASKEGGQESLLDDRDIKEQQNGNGNIKSAISSMARSRSNSKVTGNELTETVLDRRGAILDGGDGILAMLQRKDTVFLILWMGFYRLKCTWYMGQLQDQMNEQLGEDVANDLVEVYTWAFPILAAVTAIPSSIILSRFGGKEDIYMAIVLFLETIVCVCNIFPNKHMQFVAAIAFGPAQTMQWGTYFHFMYQGYRYPEAKAGRMIGFVNLFMSVIGDVMPIVLTQARSAYGVTYTAINVGLAASVILFGTLMVSHLRAERLGPSYEVGKRCCCFRKGARTDMLVCSSCSSSSSSSRTCYYATHYTLYL